jgi:hypothetical protein
MFFSNCYSVDAVSERSFGRKKVERDRLLKVTPFSIIDIDHAKNFLKKERPLSTLDQISTTPLEVLFTFTEKENKVTKARYKLSSADEVTSLVDSILQACVDYASQSKEMRVRV